MAFAALLLVAAQLLQWPIAVPLTIFGIALLFGAGLWYWRRRGHARKAGQLGDMMESVATFYDEEINRLVDTFTRLFEPLLMTFIGGVIGGIVLLLYMPIFELAGNFQ